MYSSKITTVALLVAATSIQSVVGLGGLLGPLLGGGAPSKRSDITTSMDQCIHDGRAATEHVRIVGGTTVIMDGVPASCMTEVKTWNEHPHSQLLAKDYGTVKVLNDTAVQFDGVPQKTVDLLKSAITTPQ